MSVLVKGMSMPKNCIECPFSNGEYGTCDCVNDYRIGGANEMPDWCPLEEMKDTRSQYYYDEPIGGFHDL